MCCLIQITIQLCRTRQLTCQCRQAVFFIATDENGVDPRPNPHDTAHMGRAWHGSAGAAPVVASKQTGPVPHRSQPAECTPAALAVRSEGAPPANPPPLNSSRPPAVERLQPPTRQLHRHRTRMPNEQICAVLSDHRQLVHKPDISRVTQYGVQGIHFALVIVKFSFVSSAIRVGRNKAVHRCFLVCFQHATRSNGRAKWIPYYGV